MKGLVVKPKGVKQIVIECGFINLENLHLYQKEYLKDDENNKLNDAFSLKATVSLFMDFIEEKTLLQYMVANIIETLGITILLDKTPKASSGLICRNSPTTHHISIQYSVLDFVNHIAHYQ
eukprot:10123439-Ditylum_brightwellii.AAC.1